MQPPDRPSGVRCGSAAVSWRFRPTRSTASRSIPADDDAVERLFALKGRDSAAAVPLIAADLEQAAAGRRRSAARETPRSPTAFWPGPLSIVVPREPVHRASRAWRREHRRDPGAGPRRRARAGGARSGSASPRRARTDPGQPPRPRPTPSRRPCLTSTRSSMAGHAPGGAPSTIVAFDATVRCCCAPGAVPWDRVIKSLQ